ncbi:hypothetical protein GGR56DRAFT_125488 [Xylariaceae sp. FL0804]|nr:hypothetical protein GGR56DRAFT_125488 [Xylariaceae sp. FL0804]
MARMLLCSLWGLRHGRQSRVLACFQDDTSRYVEATRGTSLCLPQVCSVQVQINRPARRRSTGRWEKSKSSDPKPDIQTFNKRVCRSSYIDPACLILCNRW